MAADPTSIPRDLRPMALTRPVVPPSSSESFHPHPLQQASSIASRTCLAHAAPNGHADPAAAAAAADDAWLDDQPSTAASRKVKFLCGFGGKILPRPSDGSLRYVGGHTRIIAVRKDATFQELMQKMVEVHGGPTVLKYQLPDEDLDALVTVSCAEDLENMMEEYDKLAAASPDGSAKMRVFLFSPAELESPIGFERGGVEFGQEAGQRYVEAVNGIVGEPSPGGLKRKDSLASASSTQNSDVDFSTEPCFSEGTSPSHHQATTTTVLPDPSKLVYVNGLPKQSMMPPVGTPGGHQAVSAQAAAPVQLEQPPPVPPYVSQPEVNIMKYPPNPGQHIQYFPQNVGLGAVAPAGYVAVPANSFVPGIRITAPPSSQLPQIGHPKPVQARLESYQEDNPYGGKIAPPPQDANSKPPHQPLSQFPPLTPPSLQVHPGTPVWPSGFQSLHTPHGHAVRLEDCFMCQKALPHVHSDTSVLDHRTSNVSAAVETNPPYHSLQAEDAMSYRAPHKLATAISTDDAKDQSVGIGIGGTTAAPLSVTHFPKVQNDTDRTAQPLTEFLEPRKPMLPPGGAAYYGDLLSFYTTPSSQLPLAYPGGPLQNQVPSTVSPVFYPGQQDLVVSKATPVAPRNQPQPSLVPALHPVNHGVLPNQVNFMDTTTSPINQAPLNFDAPFRETGNQLSDVPAVPVGGIVERLDTSPETSGIFEQQKITVKPDSSRVKDMKPECPPKYLKPNDITTPQVGGKDLLAGNDLINTGLLHEGRPSVPVEQPLPSTAAVTSMNGMPSSSQMPPLLGDHVVTGFQDLGVANNPPLPHKLLLAVPNAANKSPTGVWREQDSHFPSRLLIDDVSAMQTANVVGPLPSSAISNLKSVETHVPSHVDLLFSDPNIHGTQVLPVSPKKEAKGETLVAKDLGPEGYAKNNGATGGKGNHHIRPEAVNKDAFPELVPSYKDGKIQQEMQALSEAVAESVLHSSGSTVVDRSAPDSSYSTVGPDKSRELPNKEPITAPSDKLNLGFQITEDIERLQIIKNSDLEELRELGSGTFGTVYHGKWRGTDVAIKRINDRCFAGKASDQERLRTDFWNEACNLAGLHHPNVVAFYGVVLDGPGGSFATVTEFMVNGSLRNALQRSDRVLDWRKRLLIAMDAAFGMEYLHGKKIVHFDLKSDNLLVNLRDPHRPICKVGDLGLSKVKCQTLISGGVRGTLPWMAPELLNGCSSRVSEKVDVFSFGIVMWEILTGEEPYADLHYGAIIGGIVSNTLRPPVPESCDPEWRSLMEMCWSAEPTERPTFTEIAGKLRAMSASLPPKGPSQAGHPPASSQAQR